MNDIQQIELELIARDCNDLIRIAHGLKDSPAASAAALGIPPFFMLVAEESYKYFAALRGRQPNDELRGPLFDDFSLSVEKTRARIKLFDDHQGGLDAFMQTLALAHRKSREWFVHSHQGVVGRLTQRLQPDLGIFWHEQKPIASTHAALVTLGLTYDQILSLDVRNMREEVGRFAYQFAVAAGQYVARLAAVLGQHGLNVDLGLSPQESLRIPVTHTDHYGQRAYESISDALELSRPELSAAILFLMTQVNFVEDVLARLLEPQSTLLLRARFLTAYHATSALNKVTALENAAGGSHLAQKAKGVLNEPESQFFISMRQLRNLCAHYELRSAARLITKSGDPMDDVTKGMCGKGIAEVMEISRRHLLCISRTFVDVVSKSSLSDSRARLGNNT